MVVLAGCSLRARPATEVQPPRPPAFEEQPLQESTTVDFYISETFDQTISSDNRTLYVEGMIRNRGSRASRDVKIWAEALDAEGNVLHRDEILPTPQAIPPGEGTRFLVRFPNDPAIKRFHVEAIGH